ncbi:MAG: polysaccharide deacetylase family protein [Bacteroidales bacterium]|nr:polysaccharide deacetylase family protein [Bacteroidales bacterium]
MTTSKPTIFFRNDDVRDILDNSLIGFTETFIKFGFPVCHAVEPGNLSEKVAEWLIEIKVNQPDLIEVIQHGFNHNKDNPTIKMEFGGSRDFRSQIKDIIEGKIILDNYFGKSWTQVFTFPYGTYNQATLQALDYLGYRAISSKIQFSVTSRIKNQVGQILGKDIILGKKINYHPKFRKGYSFKEISVSANLIRRYTGYDTAEHFTLNEIIGQIKEASRYTNLIGVLFHHRFHQNQLPMIEELLTWVQSQGYPVKTFKSILEENQ